MSSPRIAPGFFREGLKEEANSISKIPVNGDWDLQCNVKIGSQVRLPLKDDSGMKT